MAGWLARRLGHLLLVMFGASCLVFLLIHLIPGDPVEVMLGEHARVADREALRARLGLDRPLPVQFGAYLGGLARGDLGRSIHSGRAVGELLLERLPATAELALAALLFAILLAIPLGVSAALHRGQARDTAAMTFSLIGVSVPNFLLGPLLILVFSLWLGWTPVSGRDGLSSLLLPALTLGSGMAAITARMVRGSLLEVLREDYIRTAHAKGLAPRAVIWRHALRDAWLPVLTLIGLQLGALLGGAVVTETVFSWPGVGSLMIESIQKRDYPIVQGCVLLISLSYVLVNMFTDLAYAWVDPRIRFGASE